QYNSLTAFNRAAAAPIYSTDPIQPDFSFWAGIFAQRPILKRISLSVGLNLHYYSAIISTGKQVINPPIASPVTSSLFYGSTGSPVTSLSYPYYPSGTGSRFTNRYYFLELPLALQWQLNRSRKLPIFWEAGLSVSRLMGADALYYDGKMGVYYKNKGYNEQTELNASTALMVGLNSGAGRMQLGPQLQYGLTSLNSGISGQHLWYGGIKFTLILGPGRSHSQAR
ncbi:MAG TPA: hypothetical protein VE035_04200, partial [Puia sp.]|nr:hypothetical protein [Puia sp.]